MQNAQKAKGLSRRSDFRKHWQLYALVALPVLYVLIFAYYPMLDAQIAFRDYFPGDSVWVSEWVGLKYFNQFFKSAQFWDVIKNTLVLSFYSILAGFPLPIFFALGLNYVRNRRFKKTIQMVSYAPYFISALVMCGIIRLFLNSRLGLVNNLVALLSGERIDFMASAAMFPSIYVWSGVWQTVGYGSIIYIAALSAINPELHEAAVIDGATKLQRCWHIDLTGIRATMVVMLIMNTGQILNVGFEKVFLLQTPLNLKSSEIISTYVYKVGLVAKIPNYSYATAIGLFQSFIGLIILYAVNKICQKISESSLW